ncbi:hypothetical protein ACFL5A_03820 [Gemmatimonadota bacterium]
MRFGGGRTLLAGTLAAGLFLPSPGHGQALHQLAASCSAGAPELSALCHETVLAFKAARGGLGLAATGGADLPGSASTLGWRLPGSPRLSFALGGGIARFSLPDLKRGGALPTGERSLLVPSAHLSASLGLFKGFSPAPTMGGLLSVDLTGTGHLVIPPSDGGFQDRVTGWGAGIRVGLFRESFTLPGVSVSFFHRNLGSVELGDEGGGVSAGARFDVRVSSVRALVGKDILGVGLLAGAGWDRYSGEVDLFAQDEEWEISSHASSDDITSRRPVYFLGASRTFLVLQLSGEVGWAPGFEPYLPDRTGGSFDPSQRQFFGSVSLRMTF